jgi:hypothetical protein
VARTAVRVGLGTIGAIAAVLLLMPLTTATPAGGLTDVKAGAMHAAGRAAPYVPYGDPSVQGESLGTIVPPIGGSAPAGPLAASPTAGPVAAVKNPTSPQPVAQLSGLNESKAKGPYGDPSLGVSPTYLVELTGYSARIESPSGKTIYSTFTLASFFNVSKTNSLYYDHVVYDALSKRWLISTLDLTTNIDYFSVSKTSSPLGAFSAYSIRATFGRGVNQFMDFTQWGVSATYWAWSADVWNSTAGTFIGNIVGLFGKVKLDGGTFAPEAFSSSDLSVTPAVSISANYSGTPTLYAASTVGYSSSTSLTVWAYTGTVPHATATTVTYTIASTGTLPAVPQPGTTVGLSLMADRVLSASWSGTGGTLWVTYTTACTPAGDSTTRTCVRVDAVATGGNSLNQDQNIGVAGMYLFAGSLVAMENGTGYLMEFGYTGGLTYPSLAVTGQAVTDSFDTYRGPIPVFTGTSYDSLGDAEATTDTQFAQTTQATAWSVGATDTSAGWETEIVHYTF